MVFPGIIGMLLTTGVVVLGEVADSTDWTVSCPSFGCINFCDSFSKNAVNSSSVIR